jgi:Leucine-rich repeat (LRR) protein
LSQNKTNMLPRGIPSSLIALDLSYNLFATFPSSEKLHNLLELKLSNNSIERLVDRVFDAVSRLD